MKPVQINVVPYKYEGQRETVQGLVDFDLYAHDPFTVYNSAIA